LLDLSSKSCALGHVEAHSPNALDPYKALVNGEFVPYFQPIVTLRTGQLAGFEVLARWIHPTHGLILPDLFIGRAENDGWINALTQKIIESAFASAFVIPAPMTLSVNISTVQLRDMHLPELFRQASELTGFPLSRLVIEITESALTENVDFSLSVTQELKTMGCNLALDDFGTGYSSLLHLQSLPFDELKLDRSFVSTMRERRQSRK
jgi:EAL domain-containing protein (putative c-di-GMP-specific phosphodiesterase class I)